jgi:hypothetical protein
MWDWLQNLSGGAAVFVGSLTGASIGLIAIVIGALFNAHLNRRRDTALRREEAKTLAVALCAELNGINRTLIENATTLSNPGSDFYTPDISHSVRLMPHLVSKLGLLDGDTIREVVDAYILIDEYCERLVILGGRIQRDVPNRRGVLMPENRAAHVVALNRVISTGLDAAVRRLHAYMR